MITWPFERPPFSVQTEALKRANGRKGFLYLLEQGLGKTAIALAEFINLRNAGLVDVMAVVCPNGLKTNWEDEAKGLGANVSCVIWPWKKKSIVANMYVYNYESMTLGNNNNKDIIPGRGGEHLSELCCTARVYLFLDECHRIKNPQSNVTRFFLRDIFKSATYRRGGTGTPYGNSPMDLYPQFRLAGELNGMNPFVFRNKFAKMGGFQGKQIVGISPGAYGDLQQLINSCAFRALKCDWTDIPPKLYTTLRVSLPDALTALYREMKEDLIVMLGSSTVSAPMVLTQLIKLQQICSGVVADDEKVKHVLVPIEKLPKFQSLLDIVDGNGQSKTIIFVYYAHTVDRVLDGLEKATKTRPAYLRGGMTHDEIRAQKANFNSDEGPGQMVIQMDTGKEGHTLLGGVTRRCTTTIFFENKYDFIVRSQCEDRAHRHGQVDNLMIYDFVSSKVEERIISALLKNKSVAEELLDNRNDL